MLCPTGQYENFLLGFPLQESKQLEPKIIYMLSMTKTLSSNLKVYLLAFSKAFTCIFFSWWSFPSWLRARFTKKMTFCKCALGFSSHFWLQSVRTQHLITKTVAHYTKPGTAQHHQITHHEFQKRNDDVINLNSLNSQRNCYYYSIAKTCLMKLGSPSPS